MPAVLRATNEEIIRAYRDTGSVWKAAKLLGLCGQSVHERLQRMGHIIPIRDWTDEEREELKSFAGQGIPVSQIASRLGRTYAGIACMLSELKIKHPYKRARKPQRGRGLTKIPINKLMDHLLVNVAETVNGAARRMGVSTTGLVYAIQYYAPIKWKAYVSAHSELDLKTCTGCSQSFLPLTAKQKYCSSRCGNLSRTDKDYFGGRRREAIGLAEEVCQLCLNKIKDGLSVHHMFGKQRDPKNQYLIALCRGCHHVVELLAMRSLTESPEFWENLITLALLRSGKCDLKSVFGFAVTVDIDSVSKQDVIEHLDLVPDATPRVLVEVDAL